MRVVQLVALCIFGCKYSGCEHVYQEHTLPTAVARHSRWTDDEIAFIEGTMDEPLTEVALALGRTYYATARRRSTCKRGILKI